MTSTYRILIGVLLLSSLTLSYYLAQPLALLVTVFVAVDVLISGFTGKALLEALVTPGKKKAPRNKPNQPDSAGVPSDDAVTGTVKWFSIDKGFGFIILDDEKEVFVHHRAINAKGRRVLREGQTVTLDVVQDDKGPQAQNVTVVKAAR